MSDLGDPLTYALTSEIETATLFTSANLPAPTRAQWSAVNLDAIAADGSTANLIISGADNPDEVLVDVNQSGELTTRPLSDGFELTCPEVLIGCE